MLFFYKIQNPSIVAIQEICGRIGLLTGSGLAAILGKKYSKRKVVLPIISLLIIANTINIGADIGAMAASAGLIIPQIPLNIFSIFVTIIIIAIIKIPYKNYVRILKYLTLSLFTYLITAIIVGGNWYQIFYATFVPHFEFSVDFATMLVAIFETTIFPYLFFGKPLKK